MFTVYCSGCLGDQLPSFCHSHERRRRSVWPLSGWQAGKDSSMQLAQHDGKNWFGHSNLSLSVSGQQMQVFSKFSPDQALPTPLALSCLVLRCELEAYSAQQRDCEMLQSKDLGLVVIYVFVLLSLKAWLSLRWNSFGQLEKVAKTNSRSVWQQTGHVHCIPHWPQAMAHCGFCFSAACWCSARTVDIVAWFEQNASGIPRSKVVVTGSVIGYLGAVFFMQEGCLRCADLLQQWGKRPVLQTWLLLFNGPEVDTTYNDHPWFVDDPLTKLLQSLTTWHFEALTWFSCLSFGAGKGLYQAAPFLFKVQLFTTSNLEIPGVVRGVHCQGLAPGETHPFS